MNGRSIGQWTAIWVFRRRSYTRCCAVGLVRVLAGGCCILSVVSPMTLLDVLVRHVAVLLVSLFLYVCGRKLFNERVLHDKQTWNMGFDCV